MKKMLWKVGAVAVTAGALLMSASAAPINPALLDARYTQDFSSYAVGTTLQTMGWEGSETANASIVDAAGRAGVKAVRAPSSDNRLWASSPVVGSGVFDFQSGESIFVSAEIRMSTGPSWWMSGGWIGFGGPGAFSTDATGNVGIQDSGNNNMGIGGSISAMTISSVASRALGTFSTGEWIEVLLVVDLHATDIALSTGSMYYRSEADGGDFLPVSDLQGINMGYTTERNPIGADRIYISASRRDFQITNIKIGEVIPEPGTTLLMLSGSGLLVALRRRLSKSHLAHN